MSCLRCEGEGGDIHGVEMKQHVEEDLAVEQVSSCASSTAIELSLRTSGGKDKISGSSAVRTASIDDVSARKVSRISLRAVWSALDAPSSQASELLILAGGYISSTCTPSLAPTAITARHDRAPAARRNRQQASRDRVRAATVPMIH